MTEREIEIQAQREANMLEWMKKLNDPHLIKTIAHYKLNGKHHFVFPWAEHGSLRTLWESSSQRLDPSYLKWGFKQLHGLANALKLLHQPVTDNIFRHGDLKPDNILCFNGKNGKLILVIADLGLATIHQQVTEERRAQGLVTGITSGTKRYLAPEAHPDPLMTKSRRYDVWAMGCIYLEFVIWLLYGDKGLREFRGPKESPKSYYLLDTKTEVPIPYVHKDVGKWISHIKNEKCCPANSAIWRLVDLISTKLLTVNIDHYHKEDPGDSDKLKITKTGPYSNFGSSSFSEEPDSSSFKLTVRAPTNNARPNPPYNSSVPYRWTSYGMCTELEGIIRDVKSRDCIWMNFDAKPSTGPKSEPERTARRAFPTDASGFLAVRPHNLVRNP
jgi:serine/threonine protein kinase